MFIFDHIIDIREETGRPGQAVKLFDGFFIRVQKMQTLTFNTIWITLLKKYQLKSL